MTTKYARQLVSARKTIVRKGTVVTWSKVANNDATDDDAPEFPSNDSSLTYQVPIVFYPQKRASLATVLEVVATGSFTDQLFAVIPGDVPFTPEINDAVMLTDGSIVHVTYVNTTQPDLTPIVYEIGLK